MKTNRQKVLRQQWTAWLLILIAIIFANSTVILVAIQANRSQKELARQSVFAEAQAVAQALSLKIVDSTKLDSDLQNLQKANGHIRRLALVITSSDPGQFRVLASSEAQYTGTLVVGFYGNVFATGKPRIDDQTENRQFRVLAPINTGDGVGAVMEAEMTSSQLAGRLLSPWYIVSILLGADALFVFCGYMLLRLRVYRQLEKDIYVYTTRQQQLLAIVAGGFVRSIKPSEDIISKITSGKYGQVTESLGIKIAELANYSQQISYTAQQLELVAELENATYQYNIAQIDVGRAVEAVVELFRPRCASKNVNINYNKPPKPLLVSADSQVLADVLARLLENSLQHIKGGRITINVVDNNDLIEVCVADTGSGIDSTMRGRLFGLFESSYSESHLGIGLWVVRQHIEAMGGGVDLDSITDKSTAVTLSLPKA